MGVNQKHLAALLVLLIIILKEHNACLSEARAVIQYKDFVLPE